MKHGNRIYIISFCEGAAVMTTELCGSKLISPYFGSSLYVWASVIAITLGSLALGYFYGGRLSLKENKKRILSTVLIGSAIYMGFMPVISNLFKFFAVRFDLIPAVISSASLLLFLPMFLMGAASPLIISLQTHQNADSGRISGLVYAISTIGGIVSTFIAGFSFIPAYGVNATLIAFSFLLLLSLIFLIEKKNAFQLLSAFLIVLISGFKNNAPLKNCVYEQDGVLGKLNVIDDTSSGKIVRKLLVNNVVQTEMDMNTGYSVSDYVALLDSNIETGPGNALVLGLGGGLTSNLLVKKGYKVQGVELDKRIVDVASRYFSMNKNVVTFCDDARHFINTSNDKFNVILIDIFKAEEQPSHVITAESLEKIKLLLAENGKLIINWHGYTSGEKGIGTAILLNTLSHQSFSYRAAAISDNEDQRNLVIFASLKQPDKLIKEVKLDITPTELINSDSHPVLEKYNALANQNWRKNYIRYYYSGGLN